MSEPVPLHRRLRGLSDSPLAGLLPHERKLLQRCAAEIDGHNEAFTQVVAHKQDAIAAQQHTEKNLRHAYQMIADWRDLLVALQVERPTDIRIRRALMGEKPMVPAQWEKKN